MQSGGTNGLVFDRVYGTGKYEIHSKDKYKYTGSIFSH
jgi:hypothetical protein